MPTGIYKRTQEHSKRISIGLIKRNKINPNPGNFKKGQTSAFKGYKHKPETLVKLSLIKKGKPMLPQTREALRKSLIGNTHTLGRKQSPERIKQMRQRMIGNKYRQGHKHTEEWKIKVSNKLKGDKCYLWKGGITPENQKIRRSREYRKWEGAVIERDMLCGKCGEDNHKNLVAHHILNFSEHADKRFDIENGKALCKRCHRWFHQIYGRKRNNHKQLKEFLTQKYERKTNN
jgi:5-methylcytosine-specific restriction endonuclease McrA